MERPIIYQILVRLFGNTKKGSKKWGSITENGCGKMEDITEKALAEIKDMGFNHIWFTGLIEHATCTDYSAHGIPADHPSVVKGVAGSPYSIKDYYDIAPDLASSVPNRMEEFEALLQRTHKQGLKGIIDFVPNHLARQYHSDSKRTGIEEFGANDATDTAYAPTNNFYYIPGEPLHVPDSQNNFRSTDEPYHEFPAKATGNDVFSSWPSINDWYETVKLNYGVAYQQGMRQDFDPIPDTWIKMKDILLFWSQKGVDGFRCDMAEMVPVEFWEWVIKEVKKTNPHIIFIAEVYQPKQYHRYLHQGGFDYLYDKVELYDTLKSIIQGHMSTDGISEVWKAQEGIIDRMLRFLENHDEQRIASPYFAEDPLKGIPMMAASAFMHKGPVMVYFGQEVGEPATGVSGFSGEDGRTTLFDYWHVPAHQKWMNGGAFDGNMLSVKQKKLREQYIGILKLCNGEPCFESGEFYDLQYFNRSETYAGYSDKVFAFIRHHEEKGILVVINFNDAAETINIKIPLDALKKLQLDTVDQINIETDVIKVSEISDSFTNYAWDKVLPPYSYQLFTIQRSH